ncbi:MAG TPA: UDP-glucose/GDP-mannose dehydrogenase family protein, partial [Candidatus Omnitrophota bacterium]|nr:UDP-glucose/GDP-mannose dehydrogenase family protein [Candidatus Omnitrophota bacterium]
IAMLGLAFKPNTDDMRFAPSLTIAEKLRQEGAHIRAYDPQSMSRAKKLPEFKGVKFCEGPYEAVKGADCTVIVTEWNEFKELDLKKAKKLMRQPVIVDGRNIYDPKKMKELGFRYSCIGRT